MPNSAEISLVAKTQATPTLYNNLVKDAVRLLAVAGSNLTISSGAVTVSPSSGEGFYIVINEGSAVTDDLETISGGADGDVIALVMNSGEVATLKHATGNIVCPGAKDFRMSSTLVTLLRFDGYYWYVLGGGGSGDESIPDGINTLALTTTPQTLVAAPAADGLLVSQITLCNANASVTTSFYIKFIRSGNNYLVVEIQLAPSESFVFDFPFHLMTTDSISAYVLATCADAEAIASYKSSDGGMLLSHISGGTYTTILTVPAGKKYAINAIAVENSYASSLYFGFQVFDSGNNMILKRRKYISPGATWLTSHKIVLNAGDYIQVATNSASGTGEIAIPYKEI